MKKIFFILIILNFVCLSPQASTTADTDLRAACEDLSVDPEIIFYTSYGKLRYDKTLARPQLSALGRKFGIFEEGALASGLALVDVASEYQLNTESRPMINGAVCIIPQQLTVYIGFQNPVIYLARDLQPDTCLYNLVVRHEQVHQQINVNALEYFIPQIYQQVKGIVAAMRPMYVSTPKLAKSGTYDMTAFYAKQINDVVDNFKQAILAEQHKLDNRKQYQMESDICTNFNNTKRQH